MVMTGVLIGCISGGSRVHDAGIGGGGGGDNVLPDACELIRESAAAAIPVLMICGGVDNILQMAATAAGTMQVF